MGPTKTFRLSVAAKEVDAGDSPRQKCPPPGEGPFSAYSLWASKESKAGGGAQRPRFCCWILHFGHGKHKPNHPGTGGCGARRDAAAPASGKDWRGERPQAVVEEPVGVLGEGDAVVEGVVAAAGELVDVGGVECRRRVPINAYLLSLTPVGSSIAIWLSNSWCQLAPPGTVSSTAEAILSNMRSSPE